MKRISTRIFCTFFLASLLASLSTLALGQVSTGTPPFGSFAGGPDVVNLGNLNVHWDIPIINKAGRAGMNFKYDATYDSSIWYPVGSSGNQSWQLAASLAPVMGWQGPNAGQPGSIQYSLTIQSSSGPGYTCTAYIYMNWVYWDSFGNQHPFNLNDGSAVVWQYGCSGGTYGADPALPWTGVTTDGSGYNINIIPSSPGCCDAPTLTATLVDKNGKTIGAPLTDGAPPPPPPVIAQDRNGNEITFSTSTSAFTDTLGTTALTLSGTAPSNTLLKYTAPSGATASYTVKYTALTVQTNFGCTGITEYPPTSNNLVTEIDLPDISVNANDKYTFAYEPTPGDTHTPHYVTGRLTKVTLPTGGTISYTYTGGNNGIICSDGSAAGLTRTTPDGEWTYSRTLVSGNEWYTTVESPNDSQNTPSAPDYTVLYFQKDSATVSTYNFYETERLAYQGSSTSGTLLRTTTTCYNANTANCTTTAVSSPITQRTITTILPGSLNRQAQHVDTYDTYGANTEQEDYDYGSGEPGSLLRKILTTYTVLGTGYQTYELPASVTVQNGSGSTVAETSYAYNQGTPSTSSGTPQFTATPSQRGNLTTVTLPTGLTKTFTYWDNGDLNVATDVNGGTTTPSGYTCGNSFPTTITEAVTTLTTQATWNCTGGVQLTSVDENSQTTTTTYTDPYFWRPASVEDPTGAVTTFCYGLVSTSGACTLNPNQSESTLSINSGSAVDKLTTVDGLGRTILQQTRQAPGGTSFDTVENVYDAFGRVYETTVPYSGTEGQTSSTAPVVTTTYDALNRTLLVEDADNGTTAYSYANSDVKIVVGPAPSGENTKTRQLEYDYLGRLTSVCELTSGETQGSTTWSGGTCAQNVSSQPTGYWTKYTYDALGDLLTVKQNAQATSSLQQTRTYAYDAMSRLISEANPESGTTAYTYDSDSANTCTPGSNGDLVKRIDAVGNTTCYGGYDKLHRIGNITYPSSGPYASNTPAKTFVYDSATVDSVTMLNAKSRLAEAYTGTSSAKTTDLGISYTARGETRTVYEMTPHSNPSYYQVTQTYWQHGASSQLSSTLTGLPTISYGGTIGSTVGLDGEGRITQVTAASGQNPMTAVSYNYASLPTSVTLGSKDSDAFTYDANTLRMTQFKFNVGTGSKSLTGNLTWNPDRTLGQLGITDQFNSSNSQTCTYSHDDLTRIATANCGSAASQTFSFDPFGNLYKTGSPYSFEPTYTVSTNHMATLPSFTPTYDANGNVLTDSINTYAWDADGNSTTVGSVTLTFDALDRMVEQDRSGTYTEIVYSPTGAKLALMSGTGGSTLQKAFVPLPGQALAVYTSSGLNHYRHSDWLGSARLTSSTTQTYVSSIGYDPYGGTYAPSGATDPSFTGENPDTVSSDYDFLFREYSNAGRWVSPDPAGMGAVDPTNPQSWNRYAYVVNNPLANVDPLGLWCPGADLGCDSGSLGSAYYGFMGDMTGDCDTENVMCTFWGYYVGLGSSSMSFGFDLSGDFCDSDFMPCGLPQPSLYQSIWEAAGLPTGLNCPQIGGIFSPLCGGISPVMDISLCAKQALKNHALNLGLDVIGLLPEGGAVASAFSLWQGAAALSQGRKLLQGVKLAGGIVSTANGSQDTSGWGVASTTTGVAGIALSLAPKLGKALPGIGQILALGSLGLDIGATLDDIGKCE